MDFSRLAPPPGKKVAIVGGAGGIGWSLSQVCQDLGLEVAAVDLRRSLKARKFSKQVLQIATDIHEEPKIIDSFKAIGEVWDGIDYLVNLVGYTGDLTPMAEMETQSLDDLISGNYRGSALCCREALKLMAGRRNAAIVNVSTGIANIGSSGYGGYASAKAALNALTRTLAHENAPGIRVNGIAPGGVDTAFLRGGFGQGGSETGPPSRLNISQYEAIVPLGRIATVEDIVGPILFLMIRPYYPWNQ